MSALEGFLTEDLRQELVRRECEEDGHPPANIIRSWGGQDDHALCECQRVMWVRRDRADD